MAWPSSDYFEALRIEKSVPDSRDYRYNPSRLDSLINSLLTESMVRYDFFKSEIDDLCFTTRYILSEEPSLLHLKAPINIAGNLDGQFETLMSIFEQGGLPTQSKYLFLGNYRDKCVEKLETALLLFAFKVKYPNNIFLLMGNHDGRKCRQTLIDELEIASFVSGKMVDECLQYLPVAALIDNKILCIHHGLSPHLRNLDQIRDITRPPKIMSGPGLLHDLLGYPGSTFDVKEVKRFLVQHDLHLIFCANYKIVGGFKVYVEDQIAMICSASSNLYNSRPVEFEDVGAMMSVDVNLMYSFHPLQPKQKCYDYRFMAATAQTKIRLIKGEVTPLKEASVTLTKFESSPENKPSPSKVATKYKDIFTGFKLGSWTSKWHSGNRDSQEVNPSVIKSAKDHRSVSPDPVKRAVRFDESNFASGTNTRARARATSDKSDSSELKIESEPGITTPAPEFDFDTTNMYRSKSPGVKRYIGPRV